MEMVKREKRWRWRIVKARLLVKMDFEDGNKKRNYRRIYDRVGRFVCCVDYETFLDYLDEEKYDVSDLIPSEWMETCLWNAVQLSRDVMIEYPDELKEKLMKPLPERRSVKIARKKREVEERKFAAKQGATEEMRTTAKQRVPEVQLG